MAHSFIHTSYKFSEREGYIFFISLRYTPPSGLCYAMPLAADYEVVSIFIHLLIFLGKGKKFGEGRFFQLLILLKCCGW